MLFLFRYISTYSDNDNENQCMYDIGIVSHCRHGSIVSQNPRLINSLAVSVEATTTVDGWYEVVNLNFICLEARERKWET